MKCAKTATPPISLVMLKKAAVVPEVIMPKVSSRMARSFSTRTRRSIFKNRLTRTKRMVFPIRATPNAMDCPEWLIVASVKSKATTEASIRNHVFKYRDAIAPSRISKQPSCLVQPTKMLKQVSHNQKSVVIKLAVFAKASSSNWKTTKRDGQQVVDDGRHAQTVPDHVLRSRGRQYETLQQARARDLVADTAGAL